MKVDLIRYFFVGSWSTFFIQYDSFSQVPPGWLSGERVGLMTWWLLVRYPVEANFLSGVFSLLTSTEACEKSSLDRTYKVKPFPKSQILDSSKLKDFEDNNFKSGENGRKFFKWVENTMVKGEIARYEQFLLFTQCFSKTCTADT